MSLFLILNCFHPQLQAQSGVAHSSGLEGEADAVSEAMEISERQFDASDDPFHGFDVPPLKPTLRVLSLFDGIGTAYFVLQKLGLFIEKYLSSEVDEKAISLLKYKYNEDIQMLGPVENVTPSDLQCHRINFLIGGSPCAELSLVNHRRKGLEGTPSAPSRKRNHAIVIC